MRTGRRVVGTVIVAAVVVGAGAGAGLIANLVGRDRAFTIERFDVEATVTPSGTVEMLETLQVTFHEERRGIFRDIPRGGPLGRDQTTLTVFGVDSGDPDRPWNWGAESLSDGRRIRIGDAAVWLEPGTYTYRIRYDLDGLPFVWADRPDVAEVRLDVPGFGWPTDVTEVHLRMTLPGEVTDVTCVAGPTGALRNCAGQPAVDGSVVTAEFGPFAAFRAATVAVQLDPAAFAVPPQTSDRATPLGERAGWLTLPAVDLPPVPAGVALALVMMAPLVLLELLKAVLIYRDQETDRYLHQRVQPTALFAPPNDHDLAELAGLLLRYDTDAMLIGTLIDLDQRGLVHSSSRGNGKTQTLTVRPAPPGGQEPRPIESSFLAALLPTGRDITFNGVYSKSVAERANGAKAVLSKHSMGVFRRHDYQHDRARWLRSNTARSLIGLGTLAWLVGLGWFGAAAFALPRGATFPIAAAVLVGWGVAAGIWRHHRLPLNSAGRDAVGQARSFREFLATVEADQMEWAATQDSIDTRHPALRLLPYAVVLGLADSWYARFGPLIRELAAAGAAGAAWWASSQGYQGVRSSSSGSTTAPSSSGGGGGGGGGGSGGGGGGGGSW